jgi:RNA polymerase sigma factor (TIGR02999 family)
LVVHLVARDVAVKPEISRVLQATGERLDGSSQLFAALYAELHRLAERQLRRAGPALTLSTTTLLHEAYLDIAGRAGVVFPDRARFMSYAARAMRGVVIDYARRSSAKKRGGGGFDITLGDSAAAAAPFCAEPAAELHRLSDALDELAGLEPTLAELVDLHFFCGYSFVEIAELRGVSDRTVQRDFRKARLLLQHALRDAPADVPSG